MHRTRCYIMRSDHWRPHWQQHSRRPSQTWGSNVHHNMPHTRGCKTTAGRSITGCTGRAVHPDNPKNLPPPNITPIYKHQYAQARLWWWIHQGGRVMLQLGMSHVQMSQPSSKGMQGMETITLDYSDCLVLLLLLLLVFVYMLMFLSIILFWHMPSRLTKPCTHDWACTMASANESDFASVQEDAEGLANFSQWYVALVHPLT